MDAAQGKKDDAEFPKCKSSIYVTESGCTEEGWGRERELATWHYKTMLDQSLHEQYLQTVQYY